MQFRKVIHHLLYYQKRPPNQRPTILLVVLCHTLLSVSYRRVTESVNAHFQTLKLSDILLHSPKRQPLN